MWNLSLSGSQGGLPGGNDNRTRAFKSVRVLQEKWGGRKNGPAEEANARTNKNSLQAEGKLVCLGASGSI